MEINLSEAVIMFFAGTLLFLVLTIIFIAVLNKKKGNKSGIKFFTVLFMLVSSFGIITSTLVYNNVIPFSLKHGYFVRANREDTSGYKITMGGSVYFVANGLDEFATNFDNLGHEAQVRGSYTFNIDAVTFTFKNGTSQKYAVRHFGRELLVDNNITYVFVRDIETRR